MKAATAVATGGTLLVMRALVFSLVVAASMPAYADEAARKVTLAEVIAAASQTPAMRVPQHEAAAADALAGAAGAWPNPAIRIETNRLTARLVAGATVPVPVFGTVRAVRRTAAAQAEVVRGDAIVATRAVHRRAVTAWIALARADADVATAAIVATQATALERIAVGRFDAGTSGNVDVTAAKAARARAELAVATAKRTREAASAELAAMIGWDPMQPLEAVGDLPGRESLALAALQARLAGHPDRVVALRKVAAADASLAEVRSLRWPSLALDAQVSAYDPTQPGVDVLVGLAIELPIFAHVGARVRAARATGSVERARLAVAETQLAGGLVAAYRRWQSASEQLAGLERDIVPAQEQAAVLSQQAYREGARDLASALQADRDLAAVRAEVIATRSDVATAWLALLEAAGEDFTRAR
ncbi:MAG: TolC family protein [Kofleriaceae bacterium]